MVLRPKLFTASTFVALAPSHPSPALVDKVVRRFQLQSPLDRLKIKPRLRNKPNSPSQRAVHVFASGLLDASHHNIDLLWILYSTAKTSSPECLPRLAPLMSRFLHLLSRSYLRSDQERILTICNDLAPFFKQQLDHETVPCSPSKQSPATVGSGPCVCMRDPVLGNVDNKLVLVPISQCHMRRSTYQLDQQLFQKWPSTKASDHVQLCCAMKSGAVFARLVHHQVLALARIGHAAAALKVLEPYLPPQATKSAQSPSSLPPPMHDSLLVETLLSHVMSGLASQAARTRVPQEAAALHETVVHLYSTYSPTILASSPRALNSALKSMLELRQFEQAVAALKRFDTSLLSATHVTTMMVGLIRAGHAPAAVELFDSILAAPPALASTAEKTSPPSTTEIVPDTPAVTAAIQAHLANNFDLASALKTFRQWLTFRKKPVVPSLATSSASLYLALESLPCPLQSPLLSPLPARSKNSDLYLPPTAISYSTLIHSILSHVSGKHSTPSVRDAPPQDDLLRLALVLHSEMTLHEGLSSPSTTTSLLMHTLQHSSDSPAVRRQLARRLLLEFFATGAAWDDQLALTVSRFSSHLGPEWVSTLMDAYVPPIQAAAHASVVLDSGEEVRVGVARDVHEPTTKMTFAARKQRRVRVMRRRPAVVWETIRQREQERNVAEWWVRAMRGEKVGEAGTKVIEETLDGGAKAAGLGEAVPSTTV